MRMAQDDEKMHDLGEERAEGEVQGQGAALLKVRSMFWGFKLVRECTTWESSMLRKEYWGVDGPMLEKVIKSGE